VQSDREVLVARLIENTCCEDAALAREQAEIVADEVMRARAAYERVRALDTLLGLRDILRDV
jgi:hypothetical protein